MRWQRDYFGGTIFRLIGSWRDQPSDIDGDRFLVLLREHYAELEDIEKDYASRWVSAAKASAAIS